MHTQRWYQSKLIVCVRSKIPVGFDHSITGTMTPFNDTMFDGREPFGFHWLLSTCRPSQKGRSKSHLSLVATCTVLLTFSYIVLGTLDPASIQIMIYHIDIDRNVSFSNEQPYESIFDGVRGSLPKRVGTLQNGFPLFKGFCPIAAAACL